MPSVPKFLECSPFPLYLAPMAGFTDRVFRDLCKHHGANVLVSEFVMANAVLEASPQSRIWQTLSFSEYQRPVGIQLFGANPERMAEAAKRVTERLRPDFIDINLGCPAPKIVDQNAGCALLKDLPLAARVVGAVVKAVPEMPVTAKIRTGWDAQSIVAVEAAQALEAEGIVALAVHGRNRAQGYSGDANWDLIAQVANSVHLPVIGNGAVNGTYDPVTARECGVAGMMIGRAALGRPWIFRELKNALAGLPPPPPPTPQEKLSTMLNYARTLLAGEDDIRSIRTKLKPFTEGIAGARKLRAAMDAIQSFRQLEQTIADMPAAQDDSA